MYLRIRAGLLEPKHVAAMGGSPLTLYLWLHTKVRFSGEGAGTWHGKEPYRHETAATALGVSVRHVKRWFDTLRAGGYVTSTRLQRGLRVAITKYEAVERSATSVTSDEARGTKSVTSEVPHLSLQTTKSVTSEAPPTRSAREKLDKSLSRDIHSLPTVERAPAAPDAPRAVPKPNRYGEVIDAIRGRGLEYARDDRDAAAVKRSPLAPALIAEVYEAIARGTWGDDFDRKRLSVHHAIASWNAYRSARALPVAPGRRKSGSESASARIKRVFEKHGIFDEPDGYDAAGGRPDAGLGYGQARGGVPRQLLG